MTSSFKRNLHWIGSFLAVSGIVFVAFRMNELSSQLDFSHFDRLMWFGLGGLALVYALANIMLAFAWRSLLVYFGASIEKIDAVKIYGMTQLAKYVPGNIMHLASRQAMGIASGIPGWPLAKAVVWELGIISFTGGCFLILTLPQFLPIISIPISIISFIGILCLLLVCCKRYIDLNVARTLGWHTTFLGISGMVFVGVLALVVLKDGADCSMQPGEILLFCGAFVGAWLVGLITPGAPAGVGVRELVMMFLLKGLVKESDLVLAVIISRMVTVLGDVIFFLYASTLEKRLFSPKKEPE